MTSRHSLKCATRCFLLFWAGSVLLFVVGLLALIFTPKVSAEGLDGTNFKIMWEIPDKYEDGRDMPRSQITGYDIYHRVNGGPDEYLAWVPNKDDVTSFNLILTNAGRYCYQMRTVTIDFGKSQRSEPVCMDYDEKDPIPIFSYPAAPTGIQVEAIELPP